MGQTELCQWLRANSSGINGPAAEAAETIEYLAELSVKHFQQAMKNGAKANAFRIEADELRKDAIRYAWLRKQDWETGLLAVVADPKKAIKLGHDAPSRARLDAAIDAAMAAELAIGAATPKI